MLRSKCLELDIKIDQLLLLLLLLLSILVFLLITFTLHLCSILQKGQKKKKFKIIRRRKIVNESKLGRLTHSFRVTCSISGTGRFNTKRNVY